MDPIEIQRRLAGAGYPASRDELVALAEDNGADEDTLDALRSIERDEFDGPDDVMSSLAASGERT